MPCALSLVKPWNKRRNLYALLHCGRLCRPTLFRQPGGGGAPGGGALSGGGPDAVPGRGAETLGDRLRPARRREELPHPLLHPGGGGGPVRSRHRGRFHGFAGDRGDSGGTVCTPHPLRGPGGHGGAGGRLDGHGPARGGTDFFARGAGGAVPCLWPDPGGPAGGAGAPGRQHRPSGYSAAGAGHHCFEPGPTG